MIRFAIAVVLAMTAWAVPARAADVATIGCIAAKIPQALYDRVAADVAQRLLDRTDADPALREEIRAMGGQCGEQYGWSDPAIEAAVSFTYGDICLKAAQAIARDKGVDLDILARTWADFPEDLRIHRFSQDTLNSFGAKLRAAGMFTNRDHAWILGKLVAYLNVIAFSRQDFIDA